jgi:hypothetical protein
MSDVSSVACAGEPTATNARTAPAAIAARVIVRSIMAKTPVVIDVRRGL